MAHIAKSRTVIIVAHRLSAVQSANCILVLDQGRIVEQGTHKELLKINGQYASLIRLQNNTYTDKSVDATQVAT